MKNQEIHPPRLADRFLRWFCAEEVLETLQGDLYELYEKRRKKKGKLLADLYYAFDVLSALRPFAFERKRSNSNYTTMFKHYFKISWRNLLRNKGYSLINIGGLAAGMSIAILISLWIYDELSFNKYHQNYDTIARVYRTSESRGEVSTNSVQAPGIGTLLSSDYKAIFNRVVMVRSRVEERALTVGDKQFNQGGYFMQDGGPEMLSLNMRYGRWDGLAQMNSILLSGSLAEKLFGDADPVGELVTMDASYSLKVTGVYDDLPKNSEFYAASYFAPLELYVNGWTTLNVWDNSFTNIYVQLKREVTFESAAGTIEDAMLPHIDDGYKEKKPQLFLHPMSQWHLYSEFENGVQVTSKRLKAVRYYGMIGIFVLLLACINFMNLSTARSEKRAREVGILKALGSQRKQLIQQFFSESLLVSGLAFLIALVIVVVSLPAFNQVADKAISLSWGNPLFWMAGLAFTVFTGLVAGSYPALYLSSLQPVKVLKGVFRAGSMAALPRKVLVVLQFTVSISLIIGTVIVYQQLQFAKSRPVGYDREGLISLRAASPEFRGKFLLLRNELKQSGVVEEVAESNYSVTDTRGHNGGFAWHGEAYEETFNTIDVTAEYGKTVGWEFVAGRDFSRDLATDRNGIVINESAARIFGLENPVGEEITWSPNGKPIRFTILGVVKDMVKGSPYEPSEPSVIFNGNYDMEWMYIRLNPEVSGHEALPKIEAVLSEIAPSTPFDYSFVDEEYGLKFAEEERISQLVSVFAALAILISCLGLLGLSAFVAEQRIKEIGIRKVLGASVVNLWQMLSKDFVVLVVISCFVAMPLAWYFMESWLDSFIYRTQISWYVFVATGAVALVITLATVSFQAIKAATADPVKSLKVE